MERAKGLEHLKDSKYREQYEKEKIQNNFDLSANDFQLAKHMQDLASDRHYQQVYDQGEFLIQIYEYSRRVKISQIHGQLDLVSSIDPEFFSVRNLTKSLYTV